MLKVQYGCGLSAPKEWVNYDSSPSLRLQRIPLLGQFIPSGAYGRFPSNVIYGDIVRGLPIEESTVDYLYCSHVLEHLSLSEFRVALRNSYRILKHGGVFRFVLPDLERLCRDYMESTSADSAIQFMMTTSLGVESRSKSVMQILRSTMGNSKHLWMWDFKSIQSELFDTGFREIRRAQFEDSSVGAFKDIEEVSRWLNQLGVECIRPSV
jgi:SAM-dependent methyltransferase